jgi:hypothetical protein
MSKKKCFIGASVALLVIAMAALVFILNRRFSMAEKEAIDDKTDKALHDLGGFFVTSPEGGRPIHVSFSQMTDEGMKKLAGLERLGDRVRDLRLDNTKVTDTGLKELKGFKSLHILLLGGTKVTDEGLKELVGLKTLRSLDLRGTKVTDGGLAELKKALPKCYILPLDWGWVRPAGDDP